MSLPLEINVSHLLSLSVNKDPQSQCRECTREGTEGSSLSRKARPGAVLRLALLLSDAALRKTPSGRVAHQPAFMNPLVPGRAKAASACPDKNLQTGAGPREGRWVLK